MRINIISLAVSAGLLSSTACAQEVQPAEKQLVSQSTLDALLLERPMFSGSVIVAQDGEVTASNHTGYAIRDSGHLNNANTYHSIASVGKMFTAVAIAQLVEARRLDYDTPVIEIIPELAGQLGAAIMVDHLLHHTSGLGRMSGLDDATLDALQDNSDHFELVLSTGIRTDGPAEFAYRNANFQILGEIIARVSDQAYEAYVRENISTPAGMMGPVFVRRDRVEGYVISEHYIAVDYETWWNSEESIVAHDADEFVHIAPPATPAAGGGAYVTALDMIRLATALRDGKLISKAGFEAMCALGPNKLAITSGYARGCTIDVGEHGTRIGHTGSTAGVQARFFLYLEQGVDVVVLSNHDEQAAPLFGEIDNLVRSKW